MQSSENPCGDHSAGWLKTADTAESVWFAVGGASSGGAAAGSARGQGGVLQCHGGLRAA